MTFPPQAYLIGAQKAGTTSLAFLLDQHPGIALSDPKEPNFYTHHWEEGLDWYRACFNAPDDTMLLDASPSYTAMPVGLAGAVAAQPDHPLMQIPARIHQVRPDAKLIYMLREPAARAHSAHYHNVRAGRERQAFRKAITESAYILPTGNYAAQLAHYLAHFPRTAVHVILFEDFARDPLAIVQGCFRFLGVEPATFKPTAEEARNQSYLLTGFSGVLAKVMGGAGRRDAVLRAARTIVPPALEPIARRLVVRDVPALSEADRAYLKELYREPNRRLAAMTGLDLARWA